MTRAPVKPAPVDVTAMHSTTVREAMHPGIMACTPGALLPEVAQLMTACHVHCVAVVAAGGDQPPKVSGVITDLDLVRWATGGGTHLPASAVVCDPVLSVSPQACVHEAAQLMAEGGVDHLVVVEPRRHAPLGVISALDVARVLAQPVAATTRRAS